MNMKKRIEIKNRRMNMEKNQCMLSKKKNENIPVIYKNLFENQNGVLELTFDDFLIHQNKLKMKNKQYKKNQGFILFYAPWCSHCKEFKKEYENLALDYLQVMPFGAVNIENVKDGNDKLRSIAKIESIPTLKMIGPDGYLVDFPSNITYDNIIYYMNIGK